MFSRVYFIISRPRARRKILPAAIKIGNYELYTECHKHTPLY